MPLSDLDPREREIVRDCMRASVDGPFFPEWEFDIIFGLTREDLRGVLESWPDVDETNEMVVRAINNSFNNLLGYPHKFHDNWAGFIHVSGKELAGIFVKWKGRKIQNYFDGFM